MKFIASLISIVAFTAGNTLSAEEAYALQSQPNAKLLGKVSVFGGLHNVEEEYPSIKNGPSGGSLKGGLKADFGYNSYSDSYCPPWTLITKYNFSDKNYNQEIAEDSDPDQDPDDTSVSDDFTILPLDDAAAGSE